MDSLPEANPEEVLQPIPNDVLNLGTDKSIKGHDQWPRPSITVVKRFLGKQAPDYCEDVNRVSLQNKIYLDYYLFVFNSLQLQLLQIRTFTNSIYFLFKG